MAGAFHRAESYDATDVATDAEAYGLGKHRNFHVEKWKHRPEDLVPCTRCHLRGHKAGDPDRCLPERVPIAGLGQSTWMDAGPDAAIATRGDGLMVHMRKNAKTRAELKAERRRKGPYGVRKLCACHECVAGRAVAKSRTEDERWARVVREGKARCSASYMEPPQEDP
jgi:hypothetical protein